jgi:hypothetical protein
MVEVLVLGALGIGRALQHAGIVDADLADLVDVAVDGARSGVCFRIRTVQWGKGIPTEPIFFSPSTGLQDTRHVASVRP